LSVRIIYQTSGSTWTWIQYFPNDPETRYLKLGGGTVSGNLAVTGTLTKSGNNVVTVGDTGTVTSKREVQGLGGRYNLLRKPYLQRTSEQKRCRSLLLARLLFDDYSLQDVEAAVRCRSAQS
jgi:hypothetical protein